MTDNTSPIYMTAEDYQKFESVYRLTVQAKIPPEVFMDAFDIAHEDINRFSEENLFAAIDSKLYLDRVVEKFYRK